MKVPEVDRPPGSEKGPRSWLSWLARSLRWLVAAVLGLLTVRLLLADPEPLRQLSSVGSGTLLLLMGLSIANQWLMSWRFKVIMKQCAGVRLSHWRWFCLTSVAQFLNLFVPQLGHVHRAVALKRDCGLSYAAYAAGLGAFFWFELLTSFFLALVIIGWRDPTLRLGPLSVLPVLGASFLALLLMPLVLGSVMRRVRRFSGRPRPWLERLEAAVSAAVRAGHSSGFVLRFAALNVLVAAGHIASLGLAFRAVGKPLGLGDLMLFQVLLKLSSQVMLTPGNLGLTELAYGALARAVAADIQQGIAAAVLIRTLGTIVMIAMGWALGGVPVLIGRRLIVDQAAEPRGGN